MEILQNMTGRMVYGTTVLDIFATDKEVIL